MSKWVNAKKWMVNFVCDFFYSIIESHWIEFILDANLSFALSFYDSIFFLPSSNFVLSSVVLQFCVAFSKIICFCRMRKSFVFDYFLINFGRVREVNFHPFDLFAIVDVAISTTTTFLHNFEWIFLSRACARSHKISSFVDLSADEINEIELSAAMNFPLHWG